MRMRKANIVRFNFFAEQGAFTRDPATGRYRVDFDKMQTAMNALSEKLLTLQGDGDYAAAKEMTDTLGVIRPELAADLLRLDEPTSRWTSRSSRVSACWGSDGTCGSV